jgi:4-amino-4-deoxy-L-arabinose transferase-like glycosyltransferase
VISEHSISSHPHADRRSLGLSLGTVWHRLAVLAIATLAAALNFYGLSREGYNNEFYAAAVRSMSESWHNFFFASFDPGGFVTIDKPPLGFWFQVASVNVFGFNGTALLIPEAVAGVLSVLLLYSLVARTFGRVAGLIAALALAVTPISVVTSRNNTIDSILVLCVLLGAWAVLRAAETGRLRWLLLCAAFVGLGFNIKMLEAYLVVPAFGLVYLLGARTSVRRRIVHLVAALVVLLAISLSWAAAVDLTPASQRPWVDSTTTNSELDLAIGYNGLQRLTGSRSVGGSQTGPPGNGSGFARLSSGTTAAGSSATTAKSSATGSGSRLSIGGGNGPGGPGGNGGPGGVGENGPVGALRLLDTQLGSQIGWLLPLAILGFLVAVWQTRPRLRTLDDRQRSLALWGTWLLTTGVFFSIALFYHTYYLVMVAPAVAALAGIGITALWRAYRTSGSWTWWVLPLGVLAGAATEAHILSSYPAYARWLTPLVIALCGLVAAVLVLLRLRPTFRLRAGAVTALAAVIGLMAPPTVFAAYTAQHPETGNIVRAGPAAAGTLGGFGGQGGPPPGALGSGAISGASGANSGFVRLQPTPKPNP